MPSHNVECGIAVQERLANDGLCSCFCFSGNAKDRINVEEEARTIKEQASESNEMVADSAQRVIRSGEVGLGNERKGASDLFCCHFTFWVGS